MTIDTTSLGVSSENLKEFEDLCNRIYEFVKGCDSASLFVLSREESIGNNQYFDKALNAMLSDGAICNGSRGFKVNGTLSFKESIEIPREVIPNVQLDDVDEIAPIDSVRAMEVDLDEIVSNKTFFDPNDEIVATINRLPESSSKMILKECLIDMKDIGDVLGSYKNAADVINDFGNKFVFDPVDVSLFQKYIIPPNVFTYVFNRSFAYCRLMYLMYDTGYEPIFNFLLSRDSTSRSISKYPNSEIKKDPSVRFKYILDEYLKKHNNDLYCFIDVYMFLMNNALVYVNNLQNDFMTFYGSKNFSKTDETVIESRMRPFLRFGNNVEYISCGDIQVIKNHIEDCNEVRYAITIGRLYKLYVDLFKQYHIDGPDELKEFIIKYTDFKISNERILGDKSLEGVIIHFIQSYKLYDKDRIAYSFCRTFGGSRSEIRSIVDKIDMQDFSDDHSLTEEEFNTLSERLESVEWISYDNIESIFSDLHDLKEKFTEINVHSLGFIRAPGDKAYFRNTYKSFSDCLMKNDFSEDDIYTDSVKFKINMQNKSFSARVKVLERSLRIIPISDYRMINLDAPCFMEFRKVLCEYRNKVREICKRIFVTPHVLKNMRVGIPEIDDDCYDLGFYDAILLATGARHQSISGQRFYHTPNELSSYRCNTPEFIRYMIYNNGGHASVSELQSILESQYGIRSELSIIRCQVKNSTCIYSEDTDSGYLDQDTYMGMLKNEPD